jgi:predicted membrane protein
MTTDDRAHALTPRVFMGLLVVIVGLVFLLDNLRIVDAVRWFAYWPYALIAVGLVKLFFDHSRAGRVFGLIMAVGGVMIATHTYIVIHLNVWTRLWPIAIILFGVLIVSNALRRSSESPPGPSRVGPAPPGPTVASTADQRVREFAVWAGLKRRVSSPAFKQADLGAVMGGIELDLRHAGTDGGEAVVDVFVLWGGIEIVVPPDWAVSNRVTAIMGGSDDQSTGTQQARHHLIVRGVAIMGGVTIKT